MTLLELHRTLEADRQDLSGFGQIAPLNVSHALGSPLV